MTQFMISVFHDPGVQASGEAYRSKDDMQRAFDAVAAFSQDLQDSGQWVLAGGLTPPETAHTVDATGASGDAPVVSLGPRVGSGAALGGFWIVEVSSEAGAMELAAKASAACGQPVEVRALEV
ncbi:YciI family protein [Kocuria indica]|uniref:YciI family protein n=1 Tax=Kocuria marina TaxID=223184 RepID=UPI001EF66883|nr:YciI family protein [Kocuria indica]MCG7431708.1 YciI family protein [Kocuria indica]